MKILVIGGGGREHALAWKLRQSASVEKIWCAPGNDGIAQETLCEALDLTDVQAAANLAEKLGADLTVIGPELPLVLGIADEFTRRGLLVLGPEKKGAQLEGSKVFAKQFMQNHRIPTASVYGIYDSPVAARSALSNVGWPLVIKADGLCSGKGVLVTSSPGDASEFIGRLIEKREFGDGGRRVLLEEGLTGEELSYIILTDGADFISMAPARDHKRAFDGDSGPNTGGMGAYSTEDILSPELEREIIESIVRPTLFGLRKDGISYRGFLYFGLMLTPQGPKVLEYNCRLGDPETEAIVMRADFDLGAAFLGAATGQLVASSAKWAQGASISVVVAAGGYPDKPQVGSQIKGLEEAGRVSGATIFHAGTRREGSTYYTSAGRVLIASARGENLGAARDTVYDAIKRLEIEGAFYRSDIGIEKIAQARSSS